MKRSTVELVAIVSSSYFAIIILSQSLIPREFNAPLYFLLAPLFLVVLILAKDLASRATLPSETPRRTRTGRRLGWKVQQLARQIEVGVTASGEYYEAVLLGRMREVLVEKVCLETGMEKERVRETLANKVLGPGLLRDRELYKVLYGHAPARGPERVNALEKAARLVENWRA